MATSAPNQVPDWQLRLSYWFVTHKLQLKKWLMFFLIILNVCLISFSVYRAIDLLVLQADSQRQLIDSLLVESIDYLAQHQRFAPQPLELGAASVVSSGTGGYDTVVEIANPNEQWVGQRVTAQLLTNGRAAAQQNFFILPLQRRYILFFNVDELNPSNVAVQIAAIDWQRRNDFAQTAASRLAFSVSEVEFIPSSVAKSQTGLEGSILNFTITNDSAYSFWEVGIQTVLLGTSSVVGANYLTADQFLSGESRRLSARWYEPLPPVVDSQVIPLVNVTDQSVYILPR